MAEKKRKEFHPEELERRLGSLFHVFDSISGGIRVRLGLDPQPIRLRLGQARQQKPATMPHPQLGGRIFGGRFRQQPVQEEIQQQEYEEGQEQLDENSVEYWQQKMAADVEPIKGTPDWFNWERRMQYYRNRIFRIEHPHRLGMSSVNLPDKS
jgi:hypothetical protein